MKDYDVIGGFSDFIRAMILLLILTAPAFAAPTLEWDAVTLDPQGLPLSPGNEILGYNVYQCPPDVNPCTKAAGVLLQGQVIPPAVTYDLAGQPAPRTYAVTAVNKSGESLESNSVKITPGDRPKNNRMK